MKTTAQELAARLNGNEYGNEVSEADCDLAKQNNLVIVYGYSDDGVIFEGAIDEHCSGRYGETFIVAGKSVGYENELESDKAVLKKYGYDLPPLRNVEAVWTPEELEASWLIKTEDGAPFDIYEDGELFCRGVVFQV